MTHIELKLQFVGSTKNYHKYSHQGEYIATVYLLKETFPSAPPKELVFQREEM